MLFRHPVAKRVKAQILRNIVPYGGGFFPAGFGCTHRILQGANNRTIGKRVIRHTAGIFIGSHHIDYCITAIGHLPDTTFPKCSNFFQQRIASIDQPLTVFRHTIIMPGGNCHIGCDVMFKRSGQSPYRSGLCTGIIRFPREHDTFIAMGISTTNRTLHTVGTVIHHRTGYPLIQ